MSAADLLGVAAGAAICGAVSWVSIRRGLRAQRAAAARAEALPSYARHREWDYAARDERVARWFTGPPFDRGSGRTATHVLRGREAGREFLAYDHGYRTRSGRGSYTRSRQHHLSVVAVRHDLALERLHPDVVALSMDATGLDWRLDGNWVVVVREGLHTPQDVEDTLTRIDAGLDRLPR